jgi:cell division protein FtsB
MAVLREIRKRARQVAPQALLACLVAYFLYHAVQGDRGILAWLRLERDLTQSRVLESQLGRERGRLERQVGLLPPDSLDPDLLGERARVLLNYGHAEEVEVVWPEDGK